MNKVIVSKDMCKSCRYCIPVCPKHVLDVSGNVNRYGYKYVEPIHPDDCIGCALCATMCPEAAIEVYR